MTTGSTTRIITVTWKTPFFSWGKKTTFTVTGQSPDQASENEPSNYSAQVENNYGTHLNPFTLTDTAGKACAEFKTTNREHYDPRYAITSPHQAFTDIHLVPDVCTVYIKTESQSIPITPLSRKGFTFQIYGKPLPVKITSRECQAELSEELPAKLSEPAVAVLLIFILLYQTGSSAD